MNDTNNPEALDFEALRAIGDEMRQLIVGCPELVDRSAYEAWHDATVPQLETLADQVPYPVLFDHFNSTSDTLGKAKQEEESESEAFEAEKIIISASRSVVSQRSAANRKQAEAVEARLIAEAEDKLDVVKQAAEAAEIAHTEVAEVVEAVSVPWPATFDTIEAVHTYRESVSGFDVEDETTPRQSINSSESSSEVEKDEPGPYAHLSEQLTLLELEGHVSRHIHVYDDRDFEPAHDIYKRAKQKQEAGEKLGLEEDVLLTIVALWQERFLEKPYMLQFLNVYSFQDIAGIHKKLMHFSKKDRTKRPDFGDLEVRILGTAQDGKPINYKASKALRGAVKRMDTGAETRTGLTWSKLNLHAEQACDILAERVQRGGARNKFLKDYMIDVTDRNPPPGKAKIGWVFQFIVSDAMIDILGMREEEAVDEVKERFVRNIEAIDTWFEENEAVLKQVPKELRFEKRPTKRSNFRRRYRFDKNRDKQHEAVSAVYSLERLREDIKLRLAGTSDKPRHKPFERDARGALNHQMELARRVEELKEGLFTYGSKPELVSEEIVPLQ